MRSQRIAVFDVASQRLLLLGIALLFAVSFWRTTASPFIADYTVNPDAASSVARQIPSNVSSALSAPRGKESTLVEVQQRWEAIWSTDISAAERNVSNLQNVDVLIHRAERGDLEATVDLVGAAMWCLTGGPLTNITDQVGDEARACFERFGTSLQSRERLERAAFTWVLQLAAAGMEDATLYASALTRGIGPDVLGGVENDLDTRASQRALLIGQLQTLVDRGSADAASELHGHWSGGSAFRLRDEWLVLHYAQLTERLDPARTVANH